MRTLYQMLLLPFYRVWALRYVTRARTWQWGTLRLQIPVGVFHPGIYFSTPIFLRFLGKMPLKGAEVLDVGTGSGVLALFAAQQGAAVTAIDINPLAVETARANAAANGLSMQVVHSDLMDALPAGTFELVLINPPYYPRLAAHDAEYAFFAGAQLEYFDKLFQQLPAFSTENSKTWLILSEDCDWSAIHRKATVHGFSMNIIHRQKKWGELFFVAEARKS
jgi:release factor glutamine methyltransferase